MKEVHTKLMQLRDQALQVARESLDAGEMLAYRSLTDIAEKLTKLVISRDKNTVPSAQSSEMLPIFARYKGQRYDAQIDVSRINGGRGSCVLMDGEWWTASGSAVHITHTAVNGWLHFWKYSKGGVIAPIHELRK